MPEKEGGWYRNVQPWIQIFTVGALIAMPIYVVHVGGKQIQEQNKFMVKIVDEYKKSLEQLIEKRESLRLKTELLLKIVGGVGRGEEISKDPEFLTALDSVKIVFSDDEKVLEAWRHCRNLSYEKAKTPEIHTQAYMNLVFAICEVLGITNLKESDIKHMFR